MYKGLSRLSRLSTAAFVAHAAFYVAILIFQAHLLSQTSGAASKGDGVYRHCVQ